MTAPPRPYRLSMVVAPLVAWALHFVVVYSLAGLGCEDGWQLRRVAGVDALTLALIGVTVVALGAIAALGWRARRILHQRQAADTAGEPMQRRQRFLARLASIVSLLATIAVVFTATPVFMLSSCA